MSNEEISQMNAMEHGVAVPPLPPGLSYVQQRIVVVEGEPVLYQHRPKWTKAEMAGALEAIAAGDSYQSLALKRGVTVERIRQIVQKTIRKILDPMRLDEPLPANLDLLAHGIRQAGDFWVRQANRFKTG